MTGIAVSIAIVVVALLLAAMSIRVVNQYEKGVLFRLGRVIGVREPGLRIIIPVIDQLRKVSLRIVTMPIQSQGIITRDNVSVDIAAVAYFRGRGSGQVVGRHRERACGDRSDRSNHVAQRRGSAHA